jgi:hypothetical protein
LCLVDREAVAIFPRLKDCCTNAKNFLSGNQGSETGVFDAKTRAFFESGAPFVVGTVSAAGEPCATRGWGLAVVSGATTCRLLLDADDVVSLRNLAETGRIAVTAADVRTLASVQFKGRVEAINAVTPADEELAAHFCDLFYEAVEATDGTPRADLDRMTPAAFIACTVAVAEFFDQSPGPAAGSALASG